MYIYISASTSAKQIQLIRDQGFTPKFEIYIDNVENISYDIPIIKKGE